MWLEFGVDTDHLLNLSASLQHHKPMWRESHLLDFTPERFPLLSAVYTLVFYVTLCMFWNRFFFFVTFIPPDSLCPTQDECISFSHTHLSSVLGNFWLGTCVRYVHRKK